MSRKKAKSKAKGGAKSTPHRVTSKRQSLQLRPVQEATTLTFSLVDEARWMATHRSAAFDMAKNLRELPIQFVSAGYLEGTIKDLLPATETAAVQSDNESVAAPSPSASTPSLNDTLAMADMAIRSPSPSPSQSSSSGDEVIFRGRAQMPSAPVATNEDSSAPPAPQSSDGTMTASNSLNQENATARTPSLTAASTDDHTMVTADVETHVHVNVRVAPGPSADQNADSDSDADSVVNEGFQKRRGGRPVWEGTTTPWQHRSIPGIGWLPRPKLPEIDASICGDVDSRNAAMNDYMQNVEDFGFTDDMQTASAFAQREMDLDGSNHNDWQPTTPNQGQDKAKDSDNDSWNAAMLKDFGNPSTSSDGMDHLVRETDKKLIQAFEERLLHREIHYGSSDSSDQEPDEMDDETMARLLQKQEEFGMGSDKVLLSNRDDSFIAPPGGNAPLDFDRPNKKRQARLRGNKESSFPSASAMADAIAMDPYGGFDIMDTEHPSLKVKKKGRRGQMPPELEDPELNEQLQNVWENDRIKNRLKKAERENLRQQGLIGRKGKYYSSKTVEEVVESIRDFLFSDKTTLTLPPMGAHRRAAVHGAASLFNLSSKSQGSGQDRFTVLRKTHRTGTWTDDEIDCALQQRGLLKRLTGPNNPNWSAKGAKGAKGARARPRAGYKDGDIVGAHAPELGPENKGHALMEKMGWSKGMALGAKDNKGILQPIPHLVKMNKAGLQ